MPPTDARVDHPPSSTSAEDSVLDDSSSDESSEDEDYLSEKLFNRLSQSDFEKDTRPFMPEGVLNEVITRKSILNAMDIEHPNPEDEELVTFILQKAKKVFATLISIKLDQNKSLQSAMLKFREHGIDDSRLPIEDTEDKSKNVLAALEPKVKRKNKIWSGSTIAHFCNDQWRFLVPVFSTDAKTDINRYNLPHSTILPFVKKHADFDEGSFGKVYKYEIHPNHIKDPLRSVRSIPLS